MLFKNIDNVLKKNLINMNKKGELMHDIRMRLL